MFREDYELIREQALAIETKVIDRAAKADLHWVLALWERPINKCIVEHQVGYFEHICEADELKNYLADKMKKRSIFKFYITTSYGETKDGGLFDA